MVDGADAGAESPDGGGSRAVAQAGLAALCVLGLLIAAVATPAVSPAVDGDLDGHGDGGSVDGGEAGDGVDRGPGGRIPGLLDLLRWLLQDGEPADGESAPPECEIAIDPRPTPGREISVTVSRGGAPVEGALVRVDGDVIGRTNATGQVIARVPYVRTLAVSATLPDTGRCAATSDQGSPTTAIGAAALSGSSVGSTQDSSGRSNVTRTVDVEGEVRIDVVGPADPGAALPVRATIAGIPMRRATVTANGREVATTDDDGAAVVRVPDDGTRRLRIGVERGEFDGATTVVVRLLHVRVEPVAPLALPGQPAALRATIGAEPAAGAVVTLDGRRLGTTDDGGRLRFALPTDPRATLAVRRGDRSATAGVALLYAGTAAALVVPALVIVGAIAFAYRRGPAPGGAGDRLVRLLGRLRRLFGRVATRLAAVALLVATALERGLGWLVSALSRLLALLTRLAGLARAGLPAVVGALRERLAALPGTVLARLWRAASWLRCLPTRGWTLLRSLWSRDAPAAGAGRSTGPLRGPFDLRRAWRALASRVAPSTWRVRTPGEIVRAAVERGLPRGSVERLAAVFEEVEYGGRSLSDERLRHARAAAEELLGRGGDDGGKTRQREGASESAGNEPAPSASEASTTRQHRRDRR